MTSPVNDYPTTRSVVEWAAIECERQRSGERSVLWMLNGWDYAEQRNADPITEEAIVALGQIVEPRHNDGAGYRQGWVRVGVSVKADPVEVPRLMTKLVGEQGDFHADEWFRQYEEIHPFGDGNGRTGSILWNWLRGTLDAPDAPPDFWTLTDADKPALIEAALRQARDRHA